MPVGAVALGAGATGWAAGFGAVAVAGAATGAGFFFNASSRPDSRTESSSHIAVGSSAACLMRSSSPTRAILARDSCTLLYEMSWGLRVLLAVAGAFLLGSPAAAQIELSPAERQAAAEAAYDRGTQAYRGGDYAAAGGWYERANQLAPSANALIQAIRARERARDDRRAATLASDLVARYGERMERYAR